MSERTYVFDNGGNDCGGGMMGLIANLCQQRGMDPNMVAAMMNNRNNGFGGEGGWFMWVIFLFFLMGWGGGGWGGFGNRNGQGEGNFLAGQLANDTGRELLQQAINGNGQAISQLASTLSCDVNAIQGALSQLNQAVCNVGSQVGMTAQQTQNAIINGNCQLASQLSSCCCDLRAQIADFKGDLSLQMCQQTNTLNNGQRDLGVAVTKGFCDTAYAFRDQTCAITSKIDEGIAKVLAGQRDAEFRELQRDLQTLRDERTQYQMSALLQQQSSNLVNTLRPCPIPSYNTCNPWGCNGGYYGNGYPYGNNGCCGNNNCGSCGCGN